MRSLTKSSGRAKRTTRIPRAIPPSRPTGESIASVVCPGLMDLMDNAGALPTTPQAQQQPEWLFHLFARPATSVGVDALGSDQLPGSDWVFTLDASGVAKALSSRKRFTEAPETAAGSRRFARSRIASSSWWRS